MDSSPPHLTFFSYRSFKKTFNALFSLNCDLNNLITLLYLRLKLWTWLHHLKSIFFVTYTKKLCSNCSTQVFYGTSCLFSKRMKIGHKINCADSGPSRTFKPSLHKWNTTVHSLSRLRIQLRCHKHVHAVILRLTLIPNQY